MSLRNRWTLGVLSLAAVAILGVSTTAVYAQATEGAETPAQAPFAGWMRPPMHEDRNALLAEALGISVEELETAQDEARNAAIDQAVADGQLTQEEADLMQARQDLQAYLRDRLQSAYEEAVAQAVTSGVITQEQADQILSERDSGFFGLGSHGGGHRGRPGGRERGGHQPGGFPNETLPQPDETTPQGSSSPLTPPVGSGL